ncbi:unnamed protein product [Caenorhabditis auriculariae]|uniref:Uncharacterized protein n=1 Tax=Caenorhabditis auriculariae TaxID=2777116 RepID=A0A8S1GXV8_9PELO|nr:unnamed protein product [Caenorhabditis auriculariae]
MGESDAWLIFAKSTHILAETAFSSSLLLRATVDQFSRKNASEDISPTCSWSSNRSFLLPGPPFYDLLCPQYHFLFRNEGKRHLTDLREICADFGDHSIQRLGVKNRCRAISKTTPGKSSRNLRRFRRPQHSASRIATSVWSDFEKCLQSTIFSSEMKGSDTWLISAKKKFLQSTIFSSKMRGSDIWQIFTKCSHIDFLILLELDSSNSFHTLLHRHTPTALQLKSVVEGYHQPNKMCRQNARFFQTKRHRIVLQDVSRFLNRLQARTRRYSGWIIRNIFSFQKMRQSDICHIFTLLR